MLLVRIHYARSVRLTIPRLDRSCGLVPRLFSLGMSITICICVHPVWSLRVHMYPHCVPPPFNVPGSAPDLSLTQILYYSSEVRCKQDCCIPVYFKVLEVSFLHGASMFVVSIGTEKEWDASVAIPILYHHWCISHITTVRKSDSDGQPILLFCSCVHCSHVVPLYSNVTQ